jgi:hypothetical protein
MTSHDARMPDPHPPSVGILPPSVENAKAVNMALRNPIHPPLVERLDPTFLKLYNDYIANGPTWPTDINLVRQNFSSLYSYATSPASGVGGIGETTVPGWEKYPGEINVRVYVPPGEEPGQRKVWPVHFNFHGGGMFGRGRLSMANADILQVGLLVTWTLMLTSVTTSVLRCRAA